MTIGDWITVGVIPAAILSLVVVAVMLRKSTAPPRSRVDLSLANPSCKACHGTGVKGRQVVGEKRIRLICHCVAKATIKREQGSTK